MPPATATGTSPAATTSRQRGGARPPNLLLERWFQGVQGLLMRRAGVASTSTDVPSRPATSPAALEADKGERGGRSGPGGPAPHAHSTACNHAPAPAGAVFAATAAGDVPALEGALKAGGSTEETDEVCGGGSGDSGIQSVLYPPPHPSLLLLQDGRTAVYWAATNGHIEALRTLLAEAPTRLQQTRWGVEGSALRLAIPTRAVMGATAGL